MRFLTFLICCVLFASAGGAAVERRGDTYVVSGASGEVAFSAAGAIVSVRAPGQTAPIARGGEFGLWQIRFQDGTLLNAADYGKGDAARTVAIEPSTAQNRLRITFTGPEARVIVTATGTPEGVQLVGDVRSLKGTVLDFALPARMRFSPDQTERVVFPINGNYGVGAAFNAKFFQMQPQDTPSGWNQRPGKGPQAYATLYGAPLDQRPDREPATKLSVTPEGRAWLGEDLARRAEGFMAVVNRPPTKAQADLVLLESPSGAWFSAKRLGSGAIWRLGGGVKEAEKNLAADVVMSATNRLAMQSTGRNKIAVIALDRGPKTGGWAEVPVEEWVSRVKGLPAVRSGKAQAVTITSVTALAAALTSNDYLTILNPYGEAVPGLPGVGIDGTLQAIDRFVRAGGNWFEAGGYSFYYVMEPIRYMTFAVNYPPAFADFVHLDTRSGSLSVYGVQPRPSQPWAAAKDKSLLFVPGRVSCGGDEKGGWTERLFNTYVAAGQEWTSPRVRMTLGKTAPDALALYCVANEISKRLPEKMKPDTLAKMKNAVLVKLNGNAKDKTQYLNLLPVPTLIHFSDYLKGGFDKEYPDHLPPNPGFGTSQELKTFFDRSQAMGHLIMPYTNPTWWCDHPRGPTFIKEGEEPLLKLLDGKPAYEKYGNNDGWTITHWHPAVQKINREVRRQFTQDFPVDILFQDQVGARTMRYDTNPASPTPYAYIDGLLSQAHEDSLIAPLGTEAGWDKVVNYESQLCGLSFGLVPNPYGPAWRHPMKEDVPPSTWSVYPLAQYIAHDKTAMLHHDLGQFVTSQELLSWTLGLGFSMSYTCTPVALTRDSTREWLNWLDRVQKSIVSPYIGEPVTAFAHDRGPAPTVADDGVIRATYGPITLAANLGPSPKQEAGRQLPQYGFIATGPGMVAGNLAQVGNKKFGEDGISFVTQTGANKTDIWVYAPADTDAAVEVAQPLKGTLTATAEGYGSVNVASQGNVLQFRLPSRASAARVAPPANLAGRAPKDWPGAKPAIGIIDLGPTQSLSWSAVEPAEWTRAFAASRLAREQGLAVKTIRTPQELAAALQAGPTAWFAIVNPYGEKYPVVNAQNWREGLEGIRRYVDNGGIWWETGGYSFHTPVPPAGSPAGPSSGPSGVGVIGIPVGGGELDAAPESLKVTDAGRQWLGDAVSARVATLQAQVNRGLPRGNEDPGHVTLVAGESGDFIGGYRLGGWGWLMRIGGMRPSADVSLPVAVAATEYLYNQPLQPFMGGGVRYVWHVSVTGKE